MATNYHECNTIFYERACDLFGEMKQQQIADMTGLAQGKVSDILSQGKFGSNPNKKPSAETVYKIAKAFNVSTDYLLGLTDYKTNNKATKELCDTLGLSEETINLLLCSKDSALYNSYKKEVEEDLKKNDDTFHSSVYKDFSELLSMSANDYVEKMCNDFVSIHAEDVSACINRMISEYIDSYINNTRNSTLLYELIVFYRMIYSEDVELYDQNDVSEVTPVPNKIFTKDSKLSFFFDDYVRDVKIKELLINSQIIEISAKLNEMLHKNLNEGEEKENQ